MLFCESLLGGFSSFLVSLSLKEERRIPEATLEKTFSISSASAQRVLMLVSVILFVWFGVCL